MKKDNPNKGKRFYTCDSRQCGFFLWESEAKKREQEALLKNNCLSENGIVARVQAKGEEAPVPAAFASKYNGGASSSRKKQAKGKESAAAATIDNTATSLPKQRLFTGRPPPPPAKKGGAKAASILSQDSEYLSWDSAGDDDDEEEEDEIAGNATKNSIISKSKSHGSLNSRSGGSSVSSVTLQNSPTNVRSRAPAPAGGREMTGPTAAPQTPNAKRKRAGFVIDEEDSDEYGGGEFDDPALSQELAQVTEASARKLQQHERYSGGGVPLAFAETPTTGMKRFGNFGGGGSSLPTPTTGGSRIGSGRGAVGGNDAENEYEYGNIAKKLRFNNEAAAATHRGGRGSHLGKDPETPTPYRKTDVFAPGAIRTTTANTTPDITSATSLFTTPNRQQQQQHQLTVNANTTNASATKPTTTTAVPPDLDIRLLGSEIKDLLSTSSHTFTMPDSIRSDLDAIIERYERRVRGLIKGRDAARAALEARDARIAELQTRIAGLENARRMDRESLRDVRRGLLKLSQLSDDEQQRD